MKSIVLLILLSGIIMIVMGYYREYSKCPNPIIEYRFIPRTFYDEQLSTPNLIKQFSSIFEDENVWLKDRNIKTPTKGSNENFYTKIV
jgi:hypothetical protein